MSAQGAAHRLERPAEVGDLVAPSGAHEWLVEAALADPRRAVGEPLDPGGDRARDEETEHERDRDRDPHRRKAVAAPGLDRLADLRRRHRAGDDHAGDPSGAEDRAGDDGDPARKLLDVAEPGKPGGDRAARVRDLEQADAGRGLGADPAPVSVEHPCRVAGLDHAVEGRGGLLVRSTPDRVGGAHGARDREVGELLAGSTRPGLADEQVCKPGGDQSYRGEGDRKIETHAEWASSDRSPPRSRWHGRIIGDRGARIQPLSRTTRTLHTVAGPGPPVSDRPRTRNRWRPSRTR